MATRMQSCWRGVRRGARFGAIVGVVIWLLLMAIVLVLVLVSPDFRMHVIEDTQKDWERWGILGVVGGFAGGFGLTAIYSAIGGMLVMGLAGYLRPGAVGDASAELPD